MKVRGLFYFALLFHISLTVVVANNEDAGAGVRDEEYQSRIVGGQEAKPNAYPYQVSLQTKFLWMKAHVCGGALLNKQWIVTAGHCMTESLLVGLLPLDAIAGTHNVINVDYFTAQISRVNKRIVHPSYKGGIGPNDIALARVKVPFVLNKKVHPIALPERDYLPHSDTQLTLTGWGLLRTSFWPDAPSKLQQVQLTYMAFDDCYELIEKLKEPSEENPLDDTSNMCTSSFDKEVAACNGDSGSPLAEFRLMPANGSVEVEDLSNEILDDEEQGNKGKELDDNPILVGIVSWGNQPCGKEHAPTVYTRVSSYIDFIDAYIMT